MDTHNALRSLVHRSNDGKPTATPSKTYEGVFASNFRSLPSVDIEELKSMSKARQFPIGREECWNACLDILCQYDTLVRIAETENSLIFSQAIVGVSDDRVTVDVLMVIHVASRGEFSSDVYFGFLSPTGLMLSRMPILNDKGEEEIKALYMANPHKIAAVLIKEQFFEQLATQLFYKYKWGNKFEKSFDATKAPDRRDE